MNTQRYAQNPSLAFKVKKSRRIALASQCDSHAWDAQSLRSKR